MLFKLQYRLSRWVRLVETMATTHFIEGVHISLIYKFPFTRTGPFERFLKWHRKNNPQSMTQKEDLQRAIVKMDGRESQGHTMQRNQKYPRDEEADETEGYVKRMKVGRGANQ